MTVIRILFISLFSAILVTAPAGAAPPVPPDAVKKKPLPAPVKFPLYKPPLRGAPASRVGSGTRGFAEDLPILVVLAPDHTGLTTSAQPTLYFYTSKPSPVPLDVTLTNDENIHPLLEVHIDASKRGGIWKVPLAAHGIRIKPGIEYRWHAALIPDMEQRSGDIIASGFLLRVEDPPGLARRLATARNEQRTFVYAETGLWYDAIESISSLIESNPGNTLYPQIRAALLDQVGLKKAAEYDRSR